MTKETKTCYLFDIDIIERKKYPQFPKLPNHALMKFSSYYKNKGYKTQLIYDKKLIPHKYDENNVYVGSALYSGNLERFKKRFNHKVIFKNTLQLKHIQIGTPTDDYPNKDIEEEKCDYTEYDKMIQTTNIKLGWYPVNVGFLTRGCYRHCEFCVNRNKTQITKVNTLENIYINKGEYIELLDDNLFASEYCVELLNSIAKFHKKHGIDFKLRNGLDCRSITPEKLKALKNASIAFNRLHCAWDITKNTFIFKNIMKIKKELNRTGTDLSCYIIMGVNINTEEELRKDILGVFYRYFCLRKIGADPVIALFEDDTGTYHAPYWDIHKTIKTNYYMMRLSKKQYLKRKLPPNRLHLADKIIEILGEYSYLVENRAGDILDDPNFNENMKKIADELQIKHRDIL